MVQLAECFDLSNSLLISLPFIKKENGGFVLKVRCFILSWIPGLYGISSSLTPIWNILGTSWSFICGQKIHGSSTIYTSLGLITWRHHLEISRDQQKLIKTLGIFFRFLFPEFNLFIFFYCFCHNICFVGRKIRPEWTYFVNNIELISATKASKPKWWRDILLKLYLGFKIIRSF